MSNRPEKTWWYEPQPLGKPDKKAPRQSALSESYRIPKVGHTEKLMQSVTPLVKPLSAPIRIGDLSNSFASQGLDIQQRRLMERLKNQHRIMKETILEDDPVHKSVGKEINSIDEPKRSKSQTVSKFEQMHHDSSKATSGHYNFALHLEDLQNEIELDQDSFGLLEGSSEIKIHKPRSVGYSSVSFKPQLFSMSSLNKYAQDQGWIIVGDYVPELEMDRLSCQFDDYGTCLYCRIHKREARKPHNDCPFKKCSCIECLDFDAKQALDELHRLTEENGLAK